MIKSAKEKKQIFTYSNDHGIETKRNETRVSSRLKVCAHKIEQKCGSKVEPYVFEEDKSTITMGGEKIGKIDAYDDL